MRGVARTLRIDFVDVLGTGGARGKPAMLCGYLDAADRRAVARRGIAHTDDRLAGEFGLLDPLRRELREHLLLRRRRARVDAIGEDLAELGAQIAI